MRHYAVPGFLRALTLGLVWAASCTQATIVFAQLTIPTFSPNVVDPDHYVSTTDTSEINEALQQIRNESDIWGAVYLLKTLDGETIEDLAERAFKKWELGQAGKDNGLLLVLAMEDRRSRFEVGYGLEGDLPDAVSGRAIDNILRPLMRRSQIKDAIVQTFRFMSATRLKSGMAETFVPIKTQPDWYSVGEHHFARGLIALAAYLALLWIWDPLVLAHAARNARRLAVRHPSYKLAQDPIIANGRPGPFWNVFGAEWKGAVLVRGFFSINPGLFIYMGAAFASWIFFALFPALLWIGVWRLREVAGRYASAEAYDRFINKERQDNATEVAKGYKRETRPGIFEFTDSWYKSDEYRASRSSSSSSSSSGSSSSSSSSGGGRSGGGGASSSW